MAASPCIQCRINPQLKSRLQAIAVERGLTESAVLKRLIVSVIGTAPASDAKVLAVEPIVRRARVHVRLRPDDHALLGPVSDDIRTPTRPATSRSTNRDLHGSNDLNAPSRSAGMVTAGSAVRVLPALRFEISEACSILRMSRAQLYHRIGEGAIKIQKDGARTYITAGELERYVQSCDTREVVPD